MAINAKVFFLFAFVMACNPVPGNEDNDSDAGAEGPRACERNSDCRDDEHCSEITGQCVADALRGEPGKNGVNCYDGVGDVNGDGNIDVQDCRGLDGADGASWVPVIENGCIVFVDGENRTDPVCPVKGDQGEPGVPGPAGPAGPQGPQGPEAECTLIGAQNCIVATCNGRTSRACVDNDNGEGGSGGAGGNGGEGGNVPPPECRYNSDCTNEPADRCIDGDTLRVFVGNGECNDNECRYPYENVNCAHGCSNGACNQAPANHDIDGDGYMDLVSGGNDCDDHDDRVHPGAEDICGNGIDEDCAYGDLECPPPVDNDFDNDGWDSDEDCDDTNDTVHPGANEQCGDGIDNDCDESADEGCNNPAPETFVEFMYRLPVDNQGTDNVADDVQALTNMFTAQGCVGEMIDYSSETDGPHGRLICNTPWMEYDNLTHNVTDLPSFDFRVGMAPGQGFEGNVYWEYFNDAFSGNNPHWACSANFQRFGTLTARTSTGVNLPVYWVDNRSGGCNPWVFWPSN